MKQAARNTVDASVHASVFILIAIAVYVHIAHPVTKQFLMSHQVETIPIGSVHASEYIERCNRVLLFTYGISFLVPVYVVVSAFRRSVFSVLVLVPYGLLLFFQIYGYFVYRASYETYGVISLSV